MTKNYFISSNLTDTPSKKIVLFSMLQESSSKHCRKADLTITYVKVTDAGEYMFVVSSDRGMSGSTITLNVTVSTALSDIVADQTRSSDAFAATSKFTIHFVIYFYSVFYLYFRAS